jgi:hypothetical protein
MIAVWKIYEVMKKHHWVFWLESPMGSMQQFEQTKEANSKTEFRKIKWEDVNTNEIGSGQELSG